MNTVKKMISVLLAVCLLLSFALPALAEGPVFSDAQTAATYLRGQMADRQTGLTFVFQADKSAIGELNGANLKSYFADRWAEITQTVFAHTGVGYEGDYLKQHTAHYGYSYGVSYSSQATTVNYNVTVTATYYTDAAQEAQVTAAVADALAGLRLAGKSDGEKVRAINDFICGAVTYDYDHLYDDAYTLKYSAYAALIDGASVCQGYASLFYRMALEAGLDVRVITGTADNGEAVGRHAWNAVRVNGSYYYHDVTWNDGTASDDYYLKGTGFEADHFSDDSIPVAISASDYVDGGTIPPAATETLATENVSRAPASFYANGQQQQPAVTVKNAAGKTLTEGMDYRVTYPTSVEPGSYLVRVDGINGYEGTVRKAYSIKPVEALDTANVTRAPAVFYANGQQQQPTVTVTNAAGKTLKEGTDYKVTYPVSIEPGSYLVRVDGINGYKGTVRKAYTVKPVEALDTANITRTPAVFYANGQQQQPAVTVKNAAGKTLKEGVDYTVTYSVSIEPGSYLVRIDGINGYKGTVRKAYTIKAVEALDTANITRTPAVFYANGKQQQPTVTVKNSAGKTLKEGTDYKVTYPVSIQPGTYMVRIDGINGYKGTVRKAYTIK